MAQTTFYFFIVLLGVVYVSSIIVTICKSIFKIGYNYWLVAISFLLDVTIFSIINRHISLALTVLEVLVLSAIVSLLSTFISVAGWEKLIVILKKHAPPEKLLDFLFKKRKKDEKGKDEKND